MAQVPQPRGLTVAPSAAPVPLQSVTAPPLAFGANVVGAGLEALGKSVEARGDSLAQHALAMQAITNKTEADQRTIDFTSTADKLTLDFQNSNRGLAAESNLSGAYDSLEQARVAAADGLSPDAQLAYNSASRQQLFRAQSTLRSFAVSERKTAVVKTSEARTNLALAEAAADPAHEGATTQTLAEEWAFRSRPDVLGLTKKEAEFGLRQDLGKMYTSQVKVALDKGNFPEAQSLYDATKKNMTAEQIDSVAGAMKVGQNAFIANGWADRITGITPPNGGPIPTPTHFDEAHARSVVESIAPGAVITSGKRTPEHNAAVGGAAHSYHLSGGALDFVPPKGTSLADIRTQLKARGLPITELLDEGDHIHWAYGSGNVGRGPAVPSFTPTTDPDKYEADSYAAIEAQSAKDFPDNPVLRATSAAAARSRVSVRVAQLRANQRATFERLGGAVLDGNVQDSATLAHAYPGAANDLANLPANYHNALEASMQHNANELTPARTESIVTLRGVRDFHPQDYIRADLSKWDLPASTRLSMMKDQQDIGAKLQKQGEKAVQTDSAVRQAMNTQPAKAALASVTQGLPAAEARNVGFNFAGALAIEIDNYTAAHGKPPTAGSKDMLGLVAQVTATVGAKKGGWFGIGGDPGHPAFVVPNAERQAIISSAAARGRVLNEYEIGQFYRRGLSAK